MVAASAFLVKSNSITGIVLVFFVLLSNLRYAYSAKHPSAAKISKE